MVKFALFGAGLIGSVHANNIAAHPRATLQYVYDVNTQAAQRAASRFGAHVASSPVADGWLARANNCGSGGRIVTREAAGQDCLLAA